MSHLENPDLIANEAGASRFKTVIAGLGVGVLALGAIKGGMIDINMPDWFEGGESDLVPRGTMIYEDQQVETASGRFMIQIGTGEALVSVKAKQNWDKGGGLFSGDFQSTNGTASVRDPQDTDNPASLAVDMRYCADGTITTETIRDGETGQETTKAVFDLGKVMVCDADFKTDSANMSAFKQDDTPDDFQGNFEAFIMGATETVAKAAPCPEDELEFYSSPSFLAHARSVVANQLGISSGNVVVRPGNIGTTDSSTQRDLVDTLDSYVNAENPEKPGETFEALKIQYLGYDEDAVSDSCYQESDEIAIEDIQEFNPQDVLENTQPQSYAGNWRRRG